MNVLFKYLIILLAFCSGFAFGISYPVSYGTSSSDTVYVDDWWNNAGEKGNSIVVERGCRYSSFKQDSIVDKNLPRDSLLARVYGNNPSPDSAALYEAWGNECEKSVKGGLSDGLFYIPVTVTIAAIGTYLTFFHDYDYLGTAILGRTYGIMSLISVPTFIYAAIHVFSRSSKQHDLGKFYKNESERFKFRVSPTINFSEPGGGLFLQLGF